MSADRAIIDRVNEVVEQVVAPQATEVDRQSRFPEEGLQALAEAGLLGLLSDPAMGGKGGDLRDAAQVVRTIAASCGSTAMVLAMHYAAVSVIEAHGPDDIRRDIAAGTHLSTLAFSETGSRSQFWAPMGTATEQGNDVVLDAHKSWVTAAAHAHSYVWTSRPATGDAGASLWLVPAATEGTEVVGRFDGLGLRGNGSCPVVARSARIPRSALLGEDGKGLDVALGLALPPFLILNASSSLGFMDTALVMATETMARTRFEHLDTRLADQAVPRSHLAHLANTAAAASALVESAADALVDGRADATLRMLQAKTVAGESAREVLDLAMRIGGGSAYRKDSGLERIFRDARASVVMAPTADSANDFVGRLLVGLPLFD